MRFGVLILLITAVLLFDCVTKAAETNVLPRPVAVAFAKGKEFEMNDRTSWLLSRLPADDETKIKAYLSET